jgi:hypothetical protein
MVTNFYDGLKRYQLGARYNLKTEIYIIDDDQSVRRAMKGRLDQMAGAITPGRFYSLSAWGTSWKKK